MSSYLQIAIVFGGLALSARLARAMKSFFPPFYIISGIILGPFGLGLVNDESIIKLFSEIGVVFLLFYLGFEFSFHKLIKKSKSLSIAGLTDLIINFGIGMVIGYIMGLDLFMIIVVAGIVYMSSSGIITKTLIQLNSVKDPEGELVMGIMIFEDLVMVIFLVFISTFSGFENGIQWTTIIINISKALGFCGVLLLVGQKYHKWIDNFLESKSKEVTLLSFLALVLIVTSIGIEFGVSEALGAFFLGMAIAKTKNSKNIENLTLKFRDIFGSIFFFSFGMEFQLGNIGVPFQIVVLASLLAVVGKILSSTLFSKLLKCSYKKGLFIGLVTTARGEFSLLIAGIVSSQSINLKTFSIILVLCTAFFSSLTLRVLDILCEKKGMCIVPKRLINAEYKPIEFEGEN